MMYCILGWQTPAFSCLFFTVMSGFLSFHTLTNGYFFKNFFGIMQTRVVLFDIKIVDDVLYCIRENQPSLAIFSIFVQLCFFQ